MSSIARSLATRSVYANTVCSCVCKSEFCYVCAKPWKTCPCDQWDEERLVEHAEAVADLEDVQYEETREEREERIQQTIEHLRTYHECDHERFQSINRRGAEFQCEVCSREYDDWIYQCRQCLMVTCNYCRHHRL